MYRVLEHAVKVVERVLAYRIRQQVKIDKMQLSILKGQALQK